MSEEIAQAAGDLAYWKHRAEQAEADAAALREALEPFARYAQIVLDQAAARDAPLRDDDIVFKLDDVAITIADLRRALEVRSA